MKTKLLCSLLFFGPQLMAMDAGDYTEPVKERSSAAQREIARRAKVERIQQEEEALREQARQDREQKKQQSLSKTVARPDARDVAPRRTEDTAPRTVTRIKMQEVEPKPHEPNKKFGGRSAFEQAMRNGDVEGMKALWEQSKNSEVSTEEFVQPLKDLYNNVAKMKEMFPELTYDQAREAITIKLIEVSPHLGKTFIDSFRSWESTRSDINNPEFLLQLRENPKLLTMPEKIKGQTPLETAIAEGNTEVAEYIIELAKYYKIKPAVLLEPIINEYKKALKNTPQDIESKVSKLGIPRLTELFQKQTEVFGQAQQA